MSESKEWQSEGQVDLHLSNFMIDGGIPREMLSRSRFNKNNIPNDFSYAATCEAGRQTPRAIGSAIGLAGHNAAVLCCAIAPSGRMIASGGYDNNVRLWRVDPPRDAGAECVGSNNEWFLTVMPALQKAEACLCTGEFPCVCVCVLMRLFTMGPGELERH